MAFGRDKPPVDVQTPYHPEQGEENRIVGIDLLGDQLVAVDQYGTAYSINHEDDEDENTFRIIRLAQTEDGNCFAVANNGEKYPISHAMFGQLGGLHHDVEVSAQNLDGFYERRLSPTKGSIEMRAHFGWEVENPEDYESGRMGTLASMAAHGRLAERALQTMYTQGAAAPPVHPDRYSPSVAGAAVAAPSAAEPSSSAVVPYTTERTSPLTLQEELLGPRNPHPSARAGEGTEAASPVSEPSRGRRLFGTKFARKVIRLGVEASLVVSVGVPLGHTVMETAGSWVPVWKFDQNDPMAFSKDIRHDLKVMFVAGPEEFVQLGKNVMGKGSH